MITYIAYDMILDVNWFKMGEIQPFPLPRTTGLTTGQYPQRAHNGCLGNGMCWYIEVLGRNKHTNKSRANL